MNKVTLVDTSSWIESLRSSGRKDVRERVKKLLINGYATWCEMILLELWCGATGEYEKSKLKEMTSELECLPITKEVWKYSFTLAEKCRKKGHTIPSTDLVIASCALFYKVELEHCDDHFDIVYKIVNKE